MVFEFHDVHPQTVFKCLLKLTKGGSAMYKLT